MSIKRRILPYRRSGEPDETLGSGFGKKLIKRFFVNPDTGETEEYVLFGQKDWSVVLAITDCEDVLVVSQFKQGCEKIVDELPAGTADWASESPAQVMTRELKQETGYEPGTVIPLKAQWMATRSSWTRFHPFLALGCKKVGEALWDTKEQIEPRSVRLEVWLNLVFSGLIEEPSAIVTTALSLPHLLHTRILTTELFERICV